MNHRRHRHKGRHRSREILVDTNILLLLLIGSIDVKWITAFKRTQTYEERDFRTLIELLARFQRIVTTPAILAETSHLASQIGDPRVAKVLAEFARNIETFDERFVESRIAAQDADFLRIGLTDAGIAVLGEKKHLVLTDDLRLARILEARGIMVINFNQLRDDEID